MNHAKVNSAWFSWPVAWLLQLKLKLNYDRRSVGQSISASGSTLYPMSRFLFFAWQLRVSWYWTPSLKRGWVCNLLIQLLTVLATAITLVYKFRRTHDHILLSHTRLPQPGGPGPRIYIPQEQVGQVILPGTGFPFHRLSRLAGLRWRYSNPLPHGVAWLLKFKLYCDRQSVGQFFSLLLITQKIPSSEIYSHTWNQLIHGNLNKLLNLPVIVGSKSQKCLQEWRPRASYCYPVAVMFSDATE
jgi:hypothetical protein